ncbi:MAG TPA: hypothetical protein PKX79_03985 [Spirochaetota bacterium]|nr:hypothetical protein [Spirochaetota bacterium]
MSSENEAREKIKSNLVIRGGVLGFIFGMLLYLAGCHDYMFQEGMMINFVAVLFCLMTGVIFSLPGFIIGFVLEKNKKS